MSLGEAKKEKESQNPLRGRGRRVWLVFFALLISFFVVLLENVSWLSWIWTMPIADADDLSSGSRCNGPSDHCT